MKPSRIILLDLRGRLLAQSVARLGSSRCLPPYQPRTSESVRSACKLIKIVDTGPAVRQRAERDMQVALDVITSLGLSPINDDINEAGNGD